jgi:hypothetical protein
MFPSLGDFSKRKLSPVENDTKSKKIKLNIQKYASNNSLLASSNSVLLPSTITELEAVLLVYTRALSPQDIAKHYKISRQRVTCIVNAISFPKPSN